MSKYIIKKHIYGDGRSTYSLHTKVFFGLLTSKPLTLRSRYMVDGSYAVTEVKTEAEIYERLQHFESVDLKEEQRRKAKIKTSSGVVDINELKTLDLIGGLESDTPTTNPQSDWFETQRGRSNI